MKIIKIFIVKFFFLIIGLLPFPLIYLISNFLSFILLRIIKYRVDVVRYNLKSSNLELSELDIKKLIKNFYSHFCDIYLEMIKLDRMNKIDVEKRLKVLNPEIANKYLKEDKSVILLVSHYGGYEWCTALDYFFEYKVAAIYTPLKDKELESLTIKSRARHGMKLISRYNALNDIRDLEKSGSNYMYGFVADQSPQIRKINYWTKFLGVEVPAFTGAERMAKELNIPVVFAKMSKLSRGKYEMRLELIAENPNEFKDFEITEKYLRLVEKQIHEKPDYYFWTHNRFKHRKN